jgi:8-oxo-dGTP pyrophosphatase MutT (NUDIX family)
MAVRNAHPTLLAIRQAAATHHATAPTNPRIAAAVAIVLAGKPDALSMCIIQRAERVGDPWSGHMALPGGRFDSRDATLRTTAERETREEVAIALPPQAYVGHVLEHTVTRTSVPILLLSAFAFYLTEETALTPSSEVAHAYWIPLRDLWSPTQQATIEHRHEGGQRAQAATKVRDQFIWGLTRRVLTHLGERAGCPLPPPVASMLPVSIIETSADVPRGT